MHFCADVEELTIFLFLGPAESVPHCTVQRTKETRTARNSFAGMGGVSSNTAVAVICVYISALYNGLVRTAL
jgi:hypothetical protein